MKFFIKTFGCQQNEYDASKLSNFLKSSGFLEVLESEADLIFVFACSVRQTAVDRLFGKVRNWIKNNKRVFITACIADDDRKKIFDKGAIFFKNFRELAELLKIKNYNYLNIRSSTAYVPIMSGCNNFCSYCIVPYTRGREISRKSEDIITEILKLLKNGTTEITLLGQNVNSYQDGDIHFSDLLEKINSLDGNFLISFVSNHPKDMSDEIIEKIAILQKVKKEVHLPIQSGSSRVLKDMNRPYTAEDYLKIVNKIRSKISNVQITTDIIVGFPTETDTDFQKTVNVCRTVGFSLAYINKYSPRKGTDAFKFGDPITWIEKQKRWKILDDLINKC